MAFLLPIAGFFGMALGSHILGKAGISVPDINANLLTIPINSNQLPSGVIGDACNHERKTHNEAKAQKEMRENEARQRREDERAEAQRREDKRTVEERLRKAQEIGILLLPHDIKFIREVPYGKRLLSENVEWRLFDMIESIKPDADTKRYVDNIDKYREFAALYYRACKNYKDGKISWSECVKIQYALKVNYDNDYWSASDNIIRYNYKVLVAYDSGLIGINQYNNLQKKLNTTYDYLNTTNPVTVHQKPSVPTPVVNRPSAPAPQPRVENGHVISAQARVNAVNQVASVVSSGASAVGNAYIQGANNIGNYNRMEAQATQQLVSNVASAVGNAYSRGSMDMANTRRMEAQATQQLVSNVASAVVNNAPQVIKETAEGVSSFGFEVATQVATGLHTTNLMISAANEALSSINGREKGVVETTGEAVATGVATYVGGQVGSVIATGLLVKTAIETNMNVVGNIIQEEINKYQQGGV